MSRFGRWKFFSMIRNREDALVVVAGASIAYLILACVLAALFFARGDRTLLHLGLFVVLGGLLWRFKSPAAAIGLLLASIMLMFVTLAQIIDTGEVDWLHVIITALAIYAGIRAMEAALKLIGRYQAPPS
ncbi:MAG: hypothetical protein ABI771_16690 [Betaproteobacteria bacterium]